jgi:hypothetical protein
MSNDEFVDEVKLDVTRDANPTLVHETVTLIVFIIRCLRSSGNCFLVRLDAAVYDRVYLYHFETFLPQTLM